MKGMEKHRRNKKPKRRRISTMGASLSPKQSTDTSLELNPRDIASRKKIVTVKTKASDGDDDDDYGKQHNSGGLTPPPDSWSWRKYGQKPIKGSPFPRGYYRCSSHKSCPAKKHVERCRTDASMLIITYTSGHNQPGSDDLPFSPAPGDHRPAKLALIHDIIIRQETKHQEQNTVPIMNSHETSTNSEDRDSQRCPSAFNSEISNGGQKEGPFVGELENAYDATGFLVDPTEEFVSWLPPLSNSSTPQKVDSDIYDQLEELPTFTSLSSFITASCFSEENMFLYPS